MSQCVTDGLAVAAYRLNAGPVCDGSAAQGSICTNAALWKTLPLQYLYKIGGWYIIYATYRLYFVRLHFLTPEVKVLSFSCLKV